MGVAAKLAGRVVKAVDALWEAENVAIENRGALPDGLQAWDFTSIKRDVERLLARLNAASEAEYADQRRREEEG